MSSPSLIKGGTRAYQLCEYHVKKPRIMVWLVYGGLYSITLFSEGTFESTVIRLAAGHVSAMLHMIFANVNGGICLR